MADPLIDYLKPGFPKESATAEAYQTMLEYVGPKDDLYGVIVKGQPWGDYQGVVEDLGGDPFEQSADAEQIVTLSVRMIRKFGSEEGEADKAGTLQETSHEIEWVEVQRPFIDHPSFQAGGDFDLNAVDRLEIERWEEMPVTEHKAAYKYYNGPLEKWDNTEDALDALGPNSEKYAQGRLLGIEYFVEQMPLLRKSTHYIDGVPPHDGGGVRENPPPDFPWIPPGYEWIRSADRSTQTGKQGEWRRDQEWLGASKVLIDSKTLYY
jgi:hypothetical protein